MRIRILGSVVALIHLLAPKRVARILPWVGTPPETNEDFSRGTVVGIRLFGLFLLGAVMWVTRPETEIQTDWDESEWEASDPSSKDARDDESPHATSSDGEITEENTENESTADQDTANDTDFEADVDEENVERSADDSGDDRDASSTEIVFQPDTTKLSVASILYDADTPISVSEVVDIASNDDRDIGQSTASATLYRLYKNDIVDRQQRNGNGKYEYWLTTAGESGLEAASPDIESFA